MSTSHAIYILENVVKDDLCETLIDLIDKHAVPETSLDTETNVTAEMLLLPTIANFDPGLYEYLNNTISNIFHTISSMMKDKENLLISGDSGYQLRKITGETRFHRDGLISEYNDPVVSTNRLRVMSVIIALNDYEGGDLYFPRQSARVHLKRGQAVLFPPYWTHPHGAEPPTNGTVRYTINTWLYGR